MLDDIRLGVRLDVDGKDFVGEIRIANKEADKLARGLRRYGRRAPAAERALRRTGGLLAVNFPAVANFHHQDAQDVILNIANDPEVPNPVTP